MAGGFFSRGLFWPNPIPEIPDHLNQTERRAYLLQTIDRNGFNWRVVVAAGSALFSSSYNLFALNSVLPALQYLYSSNNKSLYLPLNGLTLSGLVLGQLLFGFLSDKFGRRKLYGIELLIIIFAALGTAQASDGRDNSMSAVSWLLFWRFTLGLGIGAAIPLSAVITAEFAPVRSRARMMAAVFLMQPLGQLASALVSIAVATGLNSQYNGFPDKAVDQIWRIVLGSGAFTAWIALLLRFTIPESPRYTADVTSFHDVSMRHFTQMESNLSGPPQLAGSDSLPNAIFDRMTFSQASTENVGHEHVADDLSVDETASDIEYLPRQFSVSEIRQYFLVEGNWRFLLGTSFCWFSLDFAFHSLGTNNPATLAWLWNKSSIQYVLVYSQIGDYARRFILAASVGTVVGSLLLLTVINAASRKQILIWSFVFLAALFATTGGVILGSIMTGSINSAVVIVLYALCHVTFNFGPATLIYIISAEIFPTRYRSTCYGISAAAGTIGSLVVEVSLFASPSNYFEPHINRLGWILVGCSPLLILAAILASAWIPVLQSPRLEKEFSERPQDNSLILVSKSLEQLGRGIKGAEIDGDIIGFSKSFRWLLARLHITEA